MHKNSGFTLIELIIVIGMISILSAIAIPSTMKWLPNYRLKAEARNLYSNMQKAKLEAVKRKQDVLISFVAGTYDPAGQIGSYQVFVHNDADNDGAYSGGGEIGQILIQKNMPKNVTLYFNNFIVDTIANTAGYNPRGLPAGTWGKVRLRNNKSRYYQLEMSPAGAVKISQNIDGNFP
ncbi:MAG: GspH/FimT family pseudopilin [Thermodesulfobacteriota bacterium]